MSDITAEAITIPEISATIAKDLAPQTLPLIPSKPVTVSYYLNIDSRDRDRQLWPSSSHFEVKLDPPSGFAGAAIGRHFKNVVSLELMNACFPNTSNVLSAPPLFLNFPEVPGIIETTHAGTRYFAKLVPSVVLGSYVYSYQDLGGRSKKEFPFRGARLDKLTVEICDWSGTVFNFGTDNTADVAANSLIQTSMMLKVVVEESNRD